MVEFLSDCRRNKYFLLPKQSAAPKRKTSRSSHQEEPLEQPSLIDTVYGKKDNSNSSLVPSNGTVISDSKKKVAVKKKKGGDWTYKLCLD